MKSFRQFLEEKFLEWQINAGGRKNVSEFAEYLGFSQSTISTWWNETRIPQGENIQKLSAKLGIEIYDVLGLPRPDSDLFYIQTHWDGFSPEDRRVLREQAERYAEKSTRKNARPIKKRRTSRI